MDTESRDASLHETACDRATTVSIVADGSHHGGNAFDVSIESQQHASDDKDRPPIVPAESRNAQGNQTPENISVRAQPLELCHHLATFTGFCATHKLQVHDGSVISTHRRNVICLSFRIRRQAPGPSSGRSGIT